MTCTYRITAGSTVESLQADPATEQGRAAVLAAVRRVMDAAPGKRPEVNYRLIGPEHISGPLNKVLADIERAREGGDP